MNKDQLCLFTAGILLMSESGMKEVFDLHNKLDAIVAQLANVNLSRAGMSQKAFESNDDFKFVHWFCTTFASKSSDDSLYLHFFEFNEEGGLEDMYNTGKILVQVAHKLNR